MDVNTTLEKAAKSYADAPDVKELKARLRSSRFDRRQERKRIRQHAQEHLRRSVGFDQAGLIEQIMLIWAIAKWVRWIMQQIYSEDST